MYDRWLAKSVQFSIITLFTISFHIIVTKRILMMFLILNNQHKLNPIYEIL